MKRQKLSATGVLLSLALLGGGVAAVVVAQEEMDESRSLDSARDEELIPGEAELRTLAPSALQLGADLGNACICLCRTAATPAAEEWAYFERSLVSGCGWTGRLCVAGGELGTIGACAAAPAPLD